MEGTRSQCAARARRGLGTEREEEEQLSSDRRDAEEMPTTVPSTTAKLRSSLLIPLPVGFFEPSSSLNDLLPSLIGGDFSTAILTPDFTHSLLQFGSLIYK